MDTTKERTTNALQKKQALSLPKRKIEIIWREDEHVEITVSGIESMTSHILSKAMQQAQKAIHMARSEQRRTEEKKERTYVW